MQAEVEADPSLTASPPGSYNDYLLCTHALRAALYTTFSAKLAAAVFTWSLHAH